jgi:hypothetical protein
MYYPLYRFSKAYQDELMRSVSGHLLIHNSTNVSISLWRRSLSRMGDVFISLGMRMKSQNDHGVEFSRSRA